MKERFILPEEWYLIWYNKDIFTDSLKYTKKQYEYYVNSGITSDDEYISYTDFNKGVLPKKFEGYTEITHDQFIKYVLNKEVDDVTLQEPEDLSYLIEFLKLKGIK